MLINNVYTLDDHFFHLRFAEVFREKGVRAFTDFQSIYFSKISIGHSYFVYYNFLFYLVLIPFTYLTPLIVGIKLYGIFVLSFSLTIVYVFLRKISVKNPIVWTLIFLFVLLQSGLFIRFTLARPFTLAPVFLIVMLYFLYRKKYWALFIVPFLFFYWHTATFIFPFCLAFGYFIFEQFYGKKPDWKMVAMPFLGTIFAVILAYLISPGVISYLRDVIFPVFFDTAITKKTGIAEGNEVYGKNFFDVFASFFWLLFFFSIFCCYEISRYVKQKKYDRKFLEEENCDWQPMRASLFMATLIFLAASFISARFLDYFAYFCLLYVAIVYSEIKRNFEIKETVFKKSLFAGVVIALFILFAGLSLSYYEKLAISRSFLLTQGPAEWLNQNEKPGKIIFNAEWDSFPTLYYFTGDRFRYINGLEPRFLYDYDKILYWKWFNVSKGIYCQIDDCAELIEKRKSAFLKEESRKKWYEDQGNLIADSIRKDFKTDIIVAGNGNKELFGVMDNSERFKKEFFDDKNSGFAVYRVLDKK